MYSSKYLKALRDYVTPHTAIVRSVSKAGTWRMSMEWLDANYGPANPDGTPENKVRSHTMTLDEFSKKVIEYGFQYNVYMIL
jgi:hypothetical protein